MHYIKVESTSSTQHSQVESGHCISSHSAKVHWLGVEVSETVDGFRAFLTGPFGPFLGTCRAMTLLYTPLNVTRTLDVPDEGRRPPAGPEIPRRLVSEPPYTQSSPCSAPFKSNNQFLPE